MTWLFVAIGIGVLILVLWTIQHQKRLRMRAYLMQEAIRNRDFTFRLPTRGLLSGERAMQEAMNQLGETIRRQVSQNEVEAWERLTRVLTHEMMNATAPITSISQSMLSRTDVKGTPLEDGMQAIYETSKHLNDFVANYRKMSELEKPVLEQVDLLSMLDEVGRSYPHLIWETHVDAGITVHADIGMLRQVLMNLVKNALEAGATKIVAESAIDDSIDLPAKGTRQLSLFLGNDGLPIPAENRQSLFVPFFTTKRSGSGIGLSLSRRMMLQQGGMLELADKSIPGCQTIFQLSLSLYEPK